ncbi:MAG: FAD-dependent oxidoreductase [Candidatus Eisenbacteria bacterium]
MTTARQSDIAVVGAGVIGASIAAELASRGARVTVFDRGELGGGATAEGMGHLLFLADSPAQFELIGRSMELWDQLLPDLPPGCEVDKCGTLWLAADDEDLATAHEKTEGLRRFGVEAEVVDANQLRAIEPALAHDLLGAMRVPEDAVIYPPRVVSYWLHESPAANRITVRAHETVAELAPAELAPAELAPAGLAPPELANAGVTPSGGAASSRGPSPRLRVEGGDWESYSAIVIASGVGTAKLLPEVGIQPRKGHLAITDRYPGFLRHQVVELAYVKNTHMGEGDSVSMNVQPRSTGQVLIGSCRQFAGFDRSVDPVITKRMIDQAIRYIPPIQSLQVIRIWTGFRPASPDDRLGPGRRAAVVFIASGHEGLGITSALGTAELLVDLVAGAEPHVSPALYDPAARLAGKEEA